jgi:hypothetical protein
MPEVRYYIDKSRSIRKSVIIYKVDGSVHSPVIYLQKPRWISEREFDNFLKKVQISIVDESQ